MMWQPSDNILRAMTKGVETWPGKTYKGLGLVRHRRGSYVLIHLNTGHALCWLYCEEKRALKIATEVADCGDWSFKDLDQRKTVKREFLEIYEKYADVTATSGTGNLKARAEEVARLRA